MSFYEDQEDDWASNNYKGTPDMYDGAGGFGAWVDQADIDRLGSTSRATHPPRLSRTQKRRAQKKRAQARKAAADKATAVKP